MKESKIYKYTKNTKKQINTKFMTGMTQPEVALFSLWSLLKRKILETAKSLKQQISKVIYLQWIDNLLLDYYNYDSFLFPF